MKRGIIIGIAVIALVAVFGLVAYGIREHRRKAAGEKAIEALRRYEGAQSIFQPEPGPADADSRERESEPEPPKGKEPEKATGARELAEVATLTDLKAVEPMRLEGGWEVRLGIGSSGREGGPWHILYCLAKHEGADKGLELRDFEGSLLVNQLGPVFYRVVEQPRQQRIWVLRNPTSLLFRSIATAWPDDPLEGLHLFHASAVSAWKGWNHIEVLSQSGDVLAEKKVKQADPPRCYWQEFAVIGDGPSDAGRARCVARSDPTAALPIYRSRLPVNPSTELELRRLRVSLPGKVEELRPKPGKETLPEYPLRLRLQDGAFHVDSGETMVAWPDHCLLARWWKNGELAQAEKADRARNVNMLRQEVLSKSMKVGFGLPASLGEVSAGDRIGLQVLYCPEMYRQVPRESWQANERQMMVQRADHFDVASVPLLSNRIDFTVTREMLEKAAKQEPGE